MLRFLLAAAAALTLTTAAMAQEKSCTADIGADQAQVLVDRCIRVSPATHPPCNAENPCALITDEIQRGCDGLRQSDVTDPPAFCTEYSGSSQPSGY